eukprot:CAMPEP_0195514094 /NCGR_PEP_ID=MMETSP0794_2-20130614/5587_1 /TAXON_ID=515487 /ORGANISM="Stephanopyxis turris, Strain CCMP 815" /LENGTH=376 /DNA_ID=CAMNT_0040642263 /DNA_START=326 /DNA_END=1456 /DNA_ORIENTATION=-
MKKFLDVEELGGGWNDWEHEGGYQVDSHDDDDSQNPSSNDSNPEILFPEGAVTAMLAKESSAVKNTGTESSDSSETSDEYTGRRHRRRRRTVAFLVVTSIFSLSSAVFLTTNKRARTAISKKRGALSALKANGTSDDYNFLVDVNVPRLADENALPYLWYIDGSVTLHTVLEECNNLVRGETYVFDNNDAFLSRKSMLETSAAVIRGRMFSMFQDPVSRTMVEYLEFSEYRTNGKTLEEFFASEVGASKENWLTRTLSRAGSETLTQEHLESAKKMLKRKILVGLSSKFAESLTRFNKFFDWNYQNEKYSICVKKITDHKPELMTVGDQLSMERDVLVKHNEFDVSLHSYIETLFEEQGSLYPPINLPSDINMLLN